MGNVVAYKEDSAQSSPCKVVNCCNHKLTLVFFHFTVLQDVDNVLLSCWKMMKYVTVKDTVFGKAQTALGNKMEQQHGYHMVRLKRN